MSVSKLLASELGQDLFAARLIANLATYNADGTIHLVPMWFLWDGEAVLMPTSRTSRKARNLGRDSRAAVMVDDSRGGLDVRGMSLVGRAEIVGPPEAAALNRLIHLKYVTEAGLRIEGVGEVLAADDVTLRFLPVQASSWDLRDLPAARALLERREFEPLVPVHAR